jgi:2-hydroxychromene-2-carboxylate isomerase
LDEECVEIKLYSDYKSPYAYLAFDPAFELEKKYRVHVRWIPFQLRLKGKGQRSVYSEYKVKYSYLDARRWANLRGGITLKGPLKIYDTTPALIGGLFALRHGKFLEYSRLVYQSFFRRELEVDDPEVIATVIAGLGLDEAEFRAFLTVDGASEYEAAQQESVEDQIFGVPIFMFGREPFWGYDRLPLLETKLQQAGLARRP